MVRLDVSNNRLEQLPRAIGKCIRLRTLIVDHNYLEDLPKELGQRGAARFPDARRGAESVIQRAGVCSLGARRGGRPTLRDTGDMKVLIQ